MTKVKIDPYIVPLMVFFGEIFGAIFFLPNQEPNKYELLSKLKHKRIIKKALGTWNLSAILNNPLKAKVIKNVKKI